jgi:predicted polyphosphate/ATP-dependent NAD kinase
MGRKRDMIFVIILIGYGRVQCAFRHGTFPLGRMEQREKILVGIVTNPASGRDIRRLVSCASLFPTSEKVSMVTRVISALSAFGVDEVLLMPDHSGIAGGVLRAVRSHAATATDRWPEVRFIFQEVEQTENDTRRAVCAMLAQGVRTIVVLGGDGTHRVVASECGSTPLVTLSTGTYNVFPDLREATVAGIAAALCATGKIDHQRICRRNKRLNVRVGNRCEIALVDVAISRSPYVASRALWDPDDLSEIFVTFAEPDAVGLSSIAGLVRPTGRDVPEGCHVRLDAQSPEQWLCAPIGPGLICTVPVREVAAYPPGVITQIELKRGTVALDGEREIEFGPDEFPLVWLDLDGPLTVDVRRTLDLATGEGLLRIRANSSSVTNPSERKLNDN